VGIGREPAVTFNSVVGDWKGLIVQRSTITEQPTSHGEQ